MVATTDVATAERTRPDPRRARTPTAPAVRLTLLAVAAAIAVGAYYLIGASGNLDFVLAFRTRKVAALVLVGWAIAVSTVMFHTITANRILTPSLMGFDAMYQLIQTALIFGLGVIGTSALGAPVRFAICTGLMLACSVPLFWWLFAGRRRSIQLLLLIGIVIGTLLRSVSTLLQRVMDPNSFLALQSQLFASFNAVDPSLLAISAAIIVVASLVAWDRRHELDVLALGSQTATMLGVNYRRAVLRVLVLVSVLVSVSTSLVGPILFFGLLVANLAYLIIGSHRHTFTLPAAALCAVIALVGGQAILEHVFDLGTVLSVVIEFIGGLVFIGLLLRRGSRL